MFFHLLAEIGVVLLLFEIGLETRLMDLIKVGPVSALVAIVGVVLPFVMGYFCVIYFQEFSLLNLEAGMVGLRGHSDWCDANRDKRRDHG